MRNAVFLVLLVVNLASAGALVFLWHDPHRLQWVEPAAIQPALDVNVSVPNRQPVDISQFRETIERPLFVSSRRAQPALAEGADSKTDADPLKDFQLMGVFASNDRGGVVMNYSGKVERVRFGEKIGGWTVASAGGQSVSLSRGSGEQRELKVALANTAPTAAAVGAASIAPPVPTDRAGPSPSGSGAAVAGARRAADQLKRRQERAASAGPNPSAENANRARTGRQR